MVWLVEMMIVMYLPVIIMSIIIGMLEFRASILEGIDASEALSVSVEKMSAYTLFGCIVVSFIFMMLFAADMLS